MSDYVRELGALVGVVLVLSGWGVAIGIVLTVAYYVLRFTGVLPL